MNTVEIVLPVLSLKRDVDALQRAEDILWENLLDFMGTTYFEKVRQFYKVHHEIPGAPDRSALFPDTQMCVVFLD